MAANTTPDINQELARAAAGGDLTQVATLLAHGADPRCNDSAALYWASARGHADCVELLIPLSDPKADKSLALRQAASSGHADCVKLLIP